MREAEFDEWQWEEVLTVFTLEHVGLNYKNLNTTPPLYDKNNIFIFLSYSLRYKTQGGRGIKKVSTVSWHL